MLTVKRRQVLRHGHNKAAGKLEGRPSKFKLWTEEAMKKAYNSVMAGGESVRKAAEKYGVPKSTLQDRLSGRTAFGARSGPPRYLSDDEEEELVQFLMRSARIGYAKSKKQLLALVDAILMRKWETEEVHITKGWWESFKKRHPQLTIRCAEPLAYARAMATNRDTIDEYFDLLEATIKKNGLQDLPGQIYNCDESGFPLDHEGGKLIAVKGWKHFWATSSCSRDQITVLACVSATGQYMPPLVVYDRKNLKREFHNHEVPGTAYGLTAKGWVNAELFEEWFEKVFLYYAPPARPLLLLLDGHSAHYHPAVVRKAAATGVIIFCFPPHTTHFIQPLDKTVFGPLKVYWREQCRRFMAKDPGRVIKRADFGEIFSAAWYEAMTPKNITAGFRATGIYPLNRRAIRLPGDSQPSPSVPSSASKHIAYLPMYTPGRMERICSQGGDNSDSLDNESEHSSPTDPHTCIFSESYMDEVQLSNEPFTEEEINKFERRFEEGYDLRNDPRYNLWLERRERLATDFPSDVSTGETGMLSHSNPSFPEGVNAHTKRYPSRGKSKVTEKGQQQQLTVKKPSDKLALGTEKGKKPVCTSTESSPDESSDFHFTDRVKKSLSKSRKTSAGETASFSHPNPFTAEEINTFERRFEEGYDLRNDPRYNLWLERRERLATDFPSDVSTGETGMLSHSNPSVPEGVNVRTKWYPSRGKSKVPEKGHQQQLTVKKPGDKLALGTEKRKKPVCTSTESSPDESSDFQFTEEVKKSLRQFRNTSAGKTASFSHPSPFTEEEINTFERRFEEGYDLRNDPRYNLWLERRERLATDFASDVSTGETGMLSHSNPSVPEGVNARTKRYSSRVRSKVTEKNQQQQLRVKKPSDKLALGIEKGKKPVCTSTESSPDESSDFHFTDRVKKSLSKSRKTSAGETASFSHPNPFTAEEINTFERRFEEGYDLRNDPRYNLWLERRERLATDFPSDVSSGETGLLCHPNPSVPEGVNARTKRYPSRGRSKFAEKNQQQQQPMVKSSKKPSDEFALGIEKRKKPVCTSTESSPDKSLDFQFTEEVKKSLSKSRKTSPGETASFSHPNPFTAEEINTFERRFEEGYDLRNDPRYNLWLERRERLATDFPSDVSSGETGLLCHPNPSVPEGVNARTKRYPSRGRSKFAEKNQQQQQPMVKSSKKPSDEFALGIEKRKKPVCTSTESSPDKSLDFQFTE